MRKRDVDRLWKQLMVIHPNGKFWQDPKNKDVGYNRFKKSLMSANPFVGLVEKEKYMFTEENSNTQASPSGSGLQPESPFTLQTINTENDATANVETLENSQLSETDSESDKTLDIILKEMNKNSGIVKTTSKRLPQKNRVKKLCHNQMKKVFKTTVKECNVEDMCVIPKRPRGRPSKKKNPLNESNKKNEENGLKRFKFVVEYVPDHKIVLLPNKIPNAAHGGQFPLDLVMKPLTPTNSILFEDEQEEPLDLSNCSNTQLLVQSLETRDPDEISSVVTASFQESAIDMPILDNDEFHQFMNERNHLNIEMLMECVVPNQIINPPEEICSDRQEIPVENIDIYDKDSGSTLSETESHTTAENTSISTKLFIASDQEQDEGSVNTPDKKTIVQNQHIDGQTESKRIHTQTELGGTNSNSMDYLDLCSEKDLVKGGGTEKKLRNKKSMEMLAWNELSESDSSDDYNIKPQNTKDASIKDINETEDKSITGKTTDENERQICDLTNYKVSDLLDSNESLDFEPDEDAISVSTSWDGSDEELPSPAKKTECETKEEKIESISNSLPKSNEGDSLCLGSQPIQALATSTPIMTVPHAAPVAIKPPQSTFRIPKNIKKIDKKPEPSLPLVLGKETAEQHQQQLSSHPEQQAKKMMTDSNIPRLITPGSVTYTSLPPIAQRNPVTFVPNNYISPQSPMGCSIVAPIVDNMTPNSILRNQNSRLNQQTNIYKWCQDIFGITCSRSLEGNCIGNCKLSHEFHSLGEIQNALFRLNKSELQQAYLYAKRSQILFEKTMKFFVSTYAVRNQVNDLLFAIDDCTLYPNCCEQILRPIYESLIQCGYSTTNACIEIVSRFFNEKSIFKWSKLLDKIMDLIMISGWMHLFQYVIMIMNMPHYKLPPSHLSTILAEALYSDNFDLIKKIVETLSMLDVSHYKENVPKLKELLLKMQLNNPPKNERLEENHNFELNPEYATIFNKGEKH